MKDSLGNVIEVFNTSRGIKITESVMSAPQRHLGDLIEVGDKKYIIKFISYKNDKWLLDVEEV